jgi:hypothetical protein
MLSFLKPGGAEKKGFERELSEVFEREPLEGFEREPLEGSGEEALEVFERLLLMAVCQETFKRL